MQSTLFLSGYLVQGHFVIFSHREFGCSKCILKTRMDYTLRRSSSLDWPLASYIFLIDFTQDRLCCFVPPGFAASW